MRHRRIGRKFGRNPKHQRALLKALAISLIITERAPEDFDTEAQAPKKAGRIITTLPKAKELRPYVEKLLTKAIKAQESIEKAKSLAFTGEKYYKVSVTEEKYRKTGNITVTKEVKKTTKEYQEWRQSDAWKAWAQASAPAVAARRAVYAKLGSREAVDLLFDKIAPRFVGTDHKGGYTRILKLAKPRLGDAGQRALIEFIDATEYSNRKEVSAIPTVE